MATALHRARLEAVTESLLACGARSVADLGCGRGELLQWLRGHDQFTRLIGIDIDARALVRARELLGLDLLRPDDRLHVRLGSIEETDRRLPRVDAAVLLETIEHIDPGRLPRVEATVFCDLDPDHVVITTPNREYNPLHGMTPRQRRHPGHRFEWTRAQFRDWCEGVALRRYYHVRYRDIGPSDPVHGSSTQMACFSSCRRPRAAA